MKHTFIILTVALLLLLLPLVYPLALTPTRVGSNKAEVAVKVVWFRDHALRVRDNDALSAALDKSTSQLPSKIVPIYLWRSHAESLAPVDSTTGGTASDVFVANALDNLNRTLCGELSLGIVQGTSSINAQALFHTEEIVHICQATGASEVYYTESFDREFENALAINLRDRGISPVSFGGCHTLLDYSKIPPWKQIIEEHPFRSPLIPFVDYVLDELKENPPAKPKSKPLGLDESIPIRNNREQAILTNPLAIDELLNQVGYTQSRNNWGSSIAKAWPASEDHAAMAVESFLDSLAPVDLETTDSNPQATKRTHLASRMSPYLARGLLSPRQVYHALLPMSKTETASFVRRICWRDYTYAVSDLFPDAVHGEPIREGYSTERKTNEVDRKESNQRLLQLWKEGKTGFPLVDAGMRQLASEGWMPQKVRLSVSTCLVEALGCSWRDGMDHFAEFLVDYDPSINANMWMNAGCVGFDPYYVGTDYKRRPYWDKDGVYVRKWCPELVHLPDFCELPEVQRGIGTFRVDCLYEPWSAPDHILETAEVELGANYPHRCCDERSERKKFFGELQSQRRGWSLSKIDEKGRDVVRLGRQEGCESVGMFTPKALLIGKGKRQ